MGDMGDLFNWLKDFKGRRKAALGIPCPRCRELQPKRNPTILLPNQVCKVDGYIDPRPSRLVREFNEANGYTKVKHPE